MGDLGCCGRIQSPGHRIQDTDFSRIYGFSKSNIRVSNFKIPPCSLSSRRHPDAECGGRFLRTRSTAPSAMVTDRYGRPTGRLTRPHNRQDCPFSILSKLRSTMPRCAPRGVRCVCCGAPFFPEVLALPIIGHLLDPGSHPSKFAQRASIQRLGGRRRSDQRVRGRCAVPRGADKRLLWSVTCEGTHQPGVWWPVVCVVCGANNEDARDEPAETSHH